jgi:hypothetical protein
LPSPWHSTLDKQGGRITCFPAAAVIEPPICSWFPPGSPKFWSWFQPEKGVLVIVAVVREDTTESSIRYGQYASKRLPVVSFHLSRTAVAAP